MKLQNCDVQAEIIGHNIHSHQMQVKTSSKLFSMMIDGLYQDKYGSCLRELASNALDAHTDAGKSHVPFDICIPGEFSGQFSIRDYGNGLSEREIMKYFGTLLESNKSESNDLVGAYGIGCKSPFSIVDEFIVSSIKNGIRTDVVFIRENKGTPQFFVTGTFKSDEPSGTKISIDDDNRNEWIKAIRQQLIAFKVKPNINEDFSYQAVEMIGPIMKTDYARSYVCISMGQVVYPLDPKEFEGIEFFKNQISSFIYSCDIGYITVPPDRERVEMTSENKARIKALVNTQNKEAIEYLTKEFNKTYNGTLASYNAFIEKHHNSMKDIYSLANQLVKNAFISDEDMTSLTKFIPEYTDIDNFINFSNKVSLYTVACKSKIKYITYNSSQKKYTFAPFSKPTFSSLFKFGKIVLSTRRSESSILMDCLAKNEASTVYMKLNKDYIDLYASILKSVAPFYGMNPDNIIIASNASVKGTTPRVKNKVNVSGIYKSLGYESKFATEEDYHILNSNEKCLILSKTVGSTTSCDEMSDNKLHILSKYIFKNVYIMSRAKYDIYIKRDNVIDYKTFITELLDDKSRLVHAYVEQRRVYDFVRHSSYFDKSMLNIDECADAAISHYKIDVTLEYTLGNLLTMLEFVTFKPTRLSHTVANIIIRDVKECVKHIIMDNI